MKIHCQSPSSQLSWSQVSCISAGGGGGGETGGEAGADEPPPPQADSKNVHMAIHAFLVMIIVDLSNPGGRLAVVSHGAAGGHLPRDPISAVTGSITLVTVSKNGI